MAKTNIRARTYMNEIFILYTKKIGRENSLRKTERVFVWMYVLHVFIFWTSHNIVTIHDTSMTQSTFGIFDISTLKSSIGLDVKSCT